MAVTGDRWHSISLGQLVPELDPNNPGSFASLTRDKLNQADASMGTMLGSVNNSLGKVADLLNYANVAANSIRQAQNTLEDFVNNAANTGVYVKLLGVCPVDSKGGFPPSQLIKGSSQFVSEVYKAMNASVAAQIPEIAQQINTEKRLARQAKSPAERDMHLQQVQSLKQQQARLEEQADPCQPVFVGDSAFVGGFVLMIGAPNPMALYEKLLAFAELVPALKGIFQDAKKRVFDIKDSIADLASQFTDAKSIWDNYKSEFDSFNKANKIIDTSKIVQGISKGKCPDKWICAKLKDIVPMLDPNKEGSPLNIAMSFEQELVENVTAVMDRTAAMSSTIYRTMDTVNLLQSKITDLKNAVVDFSEKLAATGIYFHAIGRDLTLTNNDMFAAAVASSINDATDPQTPKFRGDTALIAGMLLVIGAPNPRGLEKEFKNVGKVFKGFSGKFGEVKDSLSAIQTNANNLWKDVTSLGGHDNSIQRQAHNTTSRIDNHNVPVSTNGGVVKAIGEPANQSYSSPAAAQAAATAAGTTYTTIPGTTYPVPPTITAVPQFTVVNGEITETMVARTFAPTAPATASPTTDGTGTPPGQLTPINGETLVQGAVPIGTSSAPVPPDPTCEDISEIDLSKQKSIVRASGGGEQIREARRRVADMNKV